MTDSYEKRGVVMRRVLLCVCAALAGGLVSAQSPQTPQAPTFRSTTSLVLVDVTVLDKDGKEVRATRRYSDTIGQVFGRIDGPAAKYCFQGDELYVRARVTSSRKHPNPSEVGEFERAWTQPAIGPAK